MTMECIFENDVKTEQQRIENVIIGRSNWTWDIGTGKAVGHMKWDIATRTVQNGGFGS